MKQYGFNQYNMAHIIYNGAYYIVYAAYTMGSQTTASIVKLDRLGHVRKHFPRKASLGV